MRVSVFGFLFFLCLTVAAQNDTASFKSILPEPREKFPSPEVLSKHPDSLLWFLSQKRQHKSQTLIEDFSVFQGETTPYRIAGSVVDKSFFNAGLQQTGSISRGVSIGNNQDLSVTSSLNLQLNGKLTDDIEISANISDRNIPIQPEGNTQNLQDLDRIFISLKYQNRLRLDAGDIDFFKPKGYYLSLQKRALGLNISAQTPLKKLSEKSTLSNQAGGGIAKGKYTKNNIVAIEGNQGPYKLVGSENEVYIMIIAGSERVYIDGKLLVRGEDRDYIMDYNLGEIRFTTNRLIRSTDRITIEFEYSDRNYARYMLFTANEFVHEKNQKLALRVNFFHEQDLKKQSIQPELSDEEKLFLSQQGNRVASAPFYRVDTVAFNPNDILYERRDTVVEGIPYSIYVHSQDPDKAHYRLSFSFVGQNKGNYNQIPSDANGRVFGWVSPLNGAIQGGYEPVILLVTPKLEQMLTIGADYEIQKNTFLTTEIAFSNHDLNTFSESKSKDNLGFAYRLTGTHKQSFNKNNPQAWYFQTQAGYEFVQKNFNPVENFRSIEFDRDYNLNSNISKTGQHIASLNLKTAQDTVGHVTLDANYMNYGSYNAVRTALSNSTKVNTFLTDNNLSFLKSKDSLNNTSFLVGKFNVGNQFRILEWGINDYFEVNHFKNATTGELFPNSYAFNESNIFLKSGAEQKVGYSVGYKNRINQTAKYNISDHDSLLMITNESMSHDVNLGLELQKLKNSTLRFTATYRHVKLFDTVSVKLPENFFLGSVDYSGRFFKGAVALTAYYSAETGLEQKREYTFIKVPSGQGTHEWIDFNQNGIQELNEFVVARFQDQADFIKIWIPTTQYENVYSNTLSGSLSLKPYLVWNNKKGVLKLLTFFSNQITMQLSQKSNSSEFWKAYTPFVAQLKDDAIIYSLKNIRNNFIINPLGSLFGMDWIFQYYENKVLLVNGFEYRILNSNQINVRYTFLKNYMLKTNYTYLLKRNTSEFFSTSNYRIPAHIAGISAHAQYQNKYRITLLYDFTYKENTMNITFTELLRSHKFGTEMNLRMAKKTNILGKFNFIMVDYNNLEQSMVSYEMLDGLNKGKNYIWGFTIQTYITDFLQLNFNYEGRAAENSKVIHTGNIQLRAFF